MRRNAHREAPSEDATLSREYGVYATNRGVLLDRLNKEVALLELRAGVRFALLSVVLACGEACVYWREADLPWIDQECTCGRLLYRHWFIKYGGEAGEEDDNQG